MIKLTITENDILEIITRVINEKKKSRKKKKDTTLCSRGKNAAKAKYDVYPSAYANGYAVQVCKGKMPDKDGVKKCSGKYCTNKN
jgi:phosphoribosylamine-glycine ligase|tara:strand:- start:776 stop:1030 length:255 start_codon:yes stop_codon:yes gene_type:complete